MELHQRITEIAEKLKQKPDNIGHQVVYLQELCYLKAEMIDILPEVKWIYNNKLAKVSEEVIAKYVDKKIPATAINNEIKGRMAAEQRVVDTVERINATISTHGDNMRTLISYQKGAY